MSESVVFSSSLLAGLETIFDIVCQPCSSGGRNAEAEGYCQDCCEHLCAQCISYHKKFSMSKHHKLVDKENMPNQQNPPTIKDVCTERCQIHRDEIIKFFCPDHKVLGCTACITLKHNVCEDVAYIPEIVADIENSKDYKEFKAKLEAMIQKSKYTADFTHDSKQRSSACLSKAIHDIDAYRQEIVDAVDTKVNELKECASQIHEQDTDKMNALADASNQVLTELQSVLSEFSTLLDNKQYCQMFIEMKRQQKNLPELEEKNKDMEGAVISDYKYEHDGDLQTTLGRESSLGKLVMRNTVKSESTAKRTSQSEVKPVAAARDIHQIKATHMADIKAKSSIIWSCNISGLALLPKGRLVAADWYNGTLKLIDTTHNKILSEHKTEKYPWDVTLCGDKIAATLPTSNKILFMKYDNGLIHDRDISVGGQCRGIECWDDKLFVIFDKEKKLEIMTTAGVILQRIETNEQGGRLFVDPTYVTVSETNKSIYVSEWGTDKLKILDMDGKLKGVYEDRNIHVYWPRQLAVDKAGVMYLCDFKNNTIHLMSPKCTKVKIILTERDGLKRPTSVCYSDTTGRLYVGMHDSDTIKVYHVS